MTDYLDYPEPRSRSQALLERMSLGQVDGELVGTRPAIAPEPAGPRRRDWLRHVITALAGQAPWRRPAASAPTWRTGAPWERPLAWPRESPGH